MIYRRELRFPPVFLNKYYITWVSERAHGCEEHPLYAVELHLYGPRESEEYIYGGESITLYEFLYSDIYGDSLTERVEQAWNTAQEHHAIQDGEKVNAELIYLQ